MTRTTERPASTAVTTRPSICTKPSRISGCKSRNSFDEHHIRRGQVEIDLKLAHEAFDGPGALPFLGVQPAAARRRQIAARDCANIVQNVGNVLNITIGETGD